jgi:hypothetical protein
VCIRSRRSVALVSVLLLNDSCIFRFLALALAFLKSLHSFFMWPSLRHQKHLLLSSSTSLVSLLAFLESLPRFLQLPLFPPSLPLPLAFDSAKLAMVESAARLGRRSSVIRNCVTASWKLHLTLSTDCLVRFKCKVLGMPRHSLRTSCRL